MRRPATSAPTMPWRELASTNGTYWCHEKWSVRATSITISTAICTPRIQIQLRRGENHSAMNSRPAAGQMIVSCLEFSRSARPRIISAE